MNGEQSEAALRAGGLVAFFLIVICVALFVLFASGRKRHAQLESERAAKIRDVSAPPRDNYEIYACVVCGAEATRRAVRTGRPWYDDLPLIRALNTLWSMPWRYTIAEDWNAPPKLCSAHRESAERKLERVHANWRARHAEFNALIQEESSVLDQGGLEQHLRDDYQRIQALYRPRATVDVGTKLLVNTSQDHHDEIRLVATQQKESE